MSSQRIKRVASTIKKELANAMLFESRNPRFKDVVITRVDMSRDLKIANVYYTNYLRRDGDETLLQAQLVKAAPYFYQLLRRRIAMKHFPELRFNRDTTCRQVEKIEEILKEIKSK